MLDLVGVEPNYDMRTPEDYDFLQRCVRDLMVMARRSGDDDQAAIFSQCKALLKRRFYLRGLKCECGNAKSRHADHCHTCYMRIRFYKVSLNEPKMKEHEIESVLTPVPDIIRKTGALSTVIRQLAQKGQVGDSFVTDKSSSSVGNLARHLGLEILTRVANPEEKDVKKRKYRVWRSDGMSMDQINQVIADRQAGKPAPLPKPCVPEARDRTSEKQKKKSSQSPPALSRPGKSA